MGGLVRFALAGGADGGGLCEQRGDLVRGHRLETAGGIESLLEDGQGFATGNDRARGQVHCVMEALGSGGRVGFECGAEAH